MKLSDITLFGTSDAHKNLGEQHRTIPDTTIDRLVAQHASMAPNVIAVIDQLRSYTYAELDDESNRIAAFLMDRQIGATPVVAVLAERSFALTAALLGILRAGATYAPINPAFPFLRQKAMLHHTAAKFLLCVRRYAHTAHALLWECPALKGFLCVDSNALATESEPRGPRMDEHLWDRVAAVSDNPIAGGGWRSAITGEPLPEWVMEDYVDNVRAKLAPHLGQHSKVLEIGCGSGLTLLALAPLAGDYLATDLSARMTECAAASARGGGHVHVRVRHLAAHDLAKLDDMDFDVVVLNSVVQSFSGYGYLRQVIASVLSLCADDAVVFLGHLWDAARREAYTAVSAYADDDDALFVAREFLIDLKHEFPEIAEVQIVPMTARAENELTAYGFDCLLRIRKSTRVVDALKLCKPRAGHHRQCLDRRALAPYANSRPVHASSPSTIAYIIFTSGSTGTPKQVGNSMRSIVNLCNWYADFCELTPDDRVYQVIACSFDASIKNYLAPLIAGAAIVLYPDVVYDPAMMLEILRREHVSVLNPGTPSQFYPLVEVAGRGHYEALSSLRVLALGGEATELERVRSWLGASTCHLAILANVYGPTECADISLAAAWHPHQLAGVDQLPIGRPIHNVSCYIVDKADQPLPAGTIGELCIAGAGVGLGYLGNEALTAQQFMVDPFNPRERAYRTGDVAWQREDGQVVLLGRRDDEIKIRGHRIMLGEIETRLRALPGVTEAAAVCRSVASERQIIAFVAGNAGAMPDGERLAALLTSALPAAMVPARIMHVNELPRNAHGKLDRAKLETFPLDTAFTWNTRAAPDGRSISSTERRVMQVWKQAIGERSLTLDSQFFLMGGHSLTLVKLHGMLLREFGHAPSLADLYAECTVRGHARLLESGSLVADTGSGRLLKGRTGRAILCFPPIAGLGWVFGTLAEYIECSRLFSFDFIPEADRIQRYVDAAARAANGEAVVLCGYSAGGNLAFQVAVELEQRGVAVMRLVLIDAEPRSDGACPSLSAILESGKRSLALLEEDAQTPVSLARLEAYARAHAAGRESQRISAPITLVLSRSMRADPSAAWARHTDGGVSTEWVVGSHDDVIGHGNIEENAPLLRRILLDSASPGMGNAVAT
ncbi:Peptide synthetase [Candidatus Paraburkholderia calva]|nr:Peptide synthetase [Candidatus Paraburkholderia calva]